MTLTKGRSPHVVGIGGTIRTGSSSEQALAVVLSGAADLGATTTMFGGDLLAQLPMYNPERAGRHPVAERLVDELRRADGIVIASPGYHGSVSGLVKNALDYTEDMRADVAPYFSGRAVGLVTTAAGWQAGVTALASLRSIVHALRGWPTPMGAVINSVESGFVDGRPVDPKIAIALQIVSAEVLQLHVAPEAAAGDARAPLLLRQLC